MKAIPRRTAPKTLPFGTSTRPHSDDSQGPPPAWRRFMSACYGKAFSHERATWLLQILPKKDPFLSRILW